MIVLQRKRQSIGCLFWLDFVLHFMLHSYIFHYMTVSIIRYKYNKIHAESPIYSRLSAYFSILLYLQE